jgi:hypothetical protein
MKAICRWLSRDALPAYVASYAKVALWCRRTPAGRPAVLLLNASADRLEKLALHVRDADRLELTSADGRTESLAKAGADGPYALFEIPTLGPWEPALLAEPGRA